MADRGYALDMSSPVRRIATELDKAAPAALSVLELANSYNHIIPGDLSRVRLHNRLATDREANAWIIEEAIRLLDRWLVIEGTGRDRTIRFAEGVTFDDLRYDRRKLVRYVDEHARLNDAFNPMSGAFSDNIRIDLGLDSSDDLRNSLKEFGWLPEFPAIMDERGVVLVGHRRLAIAKELGIEPQVRMVKLGRGDEADAQRFKLALVSNIGFKAMTPNERKRLAEYLYGEHEWTMTRIAEALNVSKSTVATDLESFPDTGKPTRPQGGRPKGAAASKVAKRNEKIVALAEQGMSTNDIAAEFKIVPRAVHRVLEVDRARKDAVEEHKQIAAAVGRVAARPGLAATPVKVGDILEVLRNAARNGRTISHAELLGAIAEIERLRGQTFEATAS